MSNGRTQPETTYGGKFEAAARIATVVTGTVNLIVMGIVLMNFRYQREVADRVWGAQLVATMFNTKECAAEPCPTAASLRAREEAVTAYVSLQRKYDKKPTLRGIDLAQAVLPGEDLKDVDFPGAKLQGATLDGVHLERTNLLGADLQNAVLKGAFLNDAVLSSAKIYGTDFQGATLTKVSFKDAKLGFCNEFDSGTGESYKSADLRGATLTGVVFEGSSLCQVDVRGTDLRDVMNLSQEQLESAKGDSKTQIPGHLTRPVHWKDEP